MAWKIMLVSGTQMNAEDKIAVPGGVAHPSTLSPGDFVCMFPDGTMPVEVESTEEV